MFILPSTDVSIIDTNGTEVQKAVVNYFDKDVNGTIDVTEAANFNTAKIKKTNNSLEIKLSNGKIDRFENMIIDKGKQYYSSGILPVAVIDTFSSEGYNGKNHGIAVCNMLKKYNQDIAITQFDDAIQKGWGPVTKHLGNFFKKHPQIEAKIYSNKKLGEFLDGCIFRYPSIRLISKSLKNIKELNDNGVQYKAVNLSSGYDCSYEEINKFCENRLKEKITPANIAKYKKQIIEILRENSNKKINTDDKTTIPVKKILDVIDSIESVEIPVYVAGAYKRNNEKTETFNLFSLADNAKTVEAGIKSGLQIKTAPFCSSNSLSIDSKTGKKHIEDSKFYDGNLFDYGSTSFSTPIALAKDLRLI